METLANDLGKSTNRVDELSHSLQTLKMKNSFLIEEIEGEKKIQKEVKQIIFERI